MNDTKMKLAHSMKALMKSSSLDKMTVADIVAGAQVTRQTFYRKFKDKYELVNWYFEELVRDSFEAINEQRTLLDALERKFLFIESERAFFKAAFKSDDCNSLIEYDYQYILKFYTSIIERKTGAPLCEDLRLPLELYCRGSIHQTVLWVSNENRPSPKRMAELLQAALPTCLEPLLIQF